MKHFRLRALVALAFVGSLVLWLASVHAAPEAALPIYDVLDLGTLDGSTSSANGINASGRVVGDSPTKEGQSHAFRWQPEVFNPLEDLTPGRGQSSTGSGINDCCEVAGTFTNTDQQARAFFRHAPGQNLDLGTLGGKRSKAFGLNNQGEVVGASETEGGQTHAFLWQSNQMRDLGTLGGGFSEAFAINDDDRAVGDSVNHEQKTHAVLWTKGDPQDLGTLGGETSSAVAINAQGQVAGWSTTDKDETHAFLWNGQMRDLGTLGGGFSTGLAINRLGQVVGTSETADGTRHAFVYSEATNMIDLNERTDFPYGEDWVLVEARGINDAGWIVGLALHNEQQRAFLLKPSGGSSNPAPRGCSECRTAGAITPAVPLPTTHIAMYRPSTGQWLVHFWKHFDRIAQLGGQPGDKPVPADYLGTGKAQIGIFRPATPSAKAQWLIRDDHGGLLSTIMFGDLGDVPVPADYLGQGHVQIAVFRPSTPPNMQQWIVRNNPITDPTPTPTTIVIPFGDADEFPVPGNYLASSTRSQAAVIRLGTSSMPMKWRIRDVRVGMEGLVVGPFELGQPGDQPLPGNYLGGTSSDQQRDEIAVVQSGPTSLKWWILDARSGAATSASAPFDEFGRPGDIPVPGAYTTLDGYDHSYVAIYNKSSHRWLIHRRDGSTLSIEWPTVAVGQDPNDVPVPAAYPLGLGLP